MEEELQDLLKQAVVSGSLHNAAERMIESCINYVVKNYKLDDQRLPIKNIVKELDHAGFFCLRNAVRMLSSATGTSRVTIYKYLHE